MSVIFHNVNVFFCNFVKINTAFMSIRDSIKNKENLTDPKLLNGSVFCG